MGAPAGPRRYRMADVLREGVCGSARVEHFEIDEQAAGWSRVRASVNGRADDAVAPGRYARLVVGNELWMSDTDMEWRTNRHAIWTSHGDVLIAGLGLGFIVLPILQRSEVTSVTVLEISRDVIDLVEPQVREAAGAAASKLRVVHADAYAWKPDARWDCIYFDVWADQSTDALKDMARLKRRYARRLVRGPGAWMACWREGELRYRRNQERRKRLVKLDDGRLARLTVLIIVAGCLAIYLLIGIHGL